MVLCKEDHSYLRKLIRGFQIVNYLFLVVQIVIVQVLIVDVSLANDRNKLIIPVLIANCEPWPPQGEMAPLLAGKIYVDLSSDEKFEKNIERLIAAINQGVN